MRLAIRRSIRRIKGILGGALFFISGLRKSVAFYFFCVFHGVNTKYLWRSFSYLASLDMDEPMVAGAVGLYGCGFFVEIKDPGAPAHFTIQQVSARRIKAYEWRKEERVEKMEYGAQIKTHWYEIYHTGRSLDIAGTNRLLKYLKFLYGEGPKDDHPGVKSAGAKGSFGFGDIRRAFESGLRARPVITNQGNEVLGSEPVDSGLSKVFEDGQGRASGQD